MKHVSIITLKLFVLTLLLFGCTMAPVKQEPVPPKPIEVSGWQASWTPIAEKALKEHAGDLLKANPKGLCPGDKLTNYLNIMIKLAKFESGYKPALTYQESFNDRFGKPVISTGLLQVSQESCGGYGMKTTTEELKRVEKNFACAARIMNKWIVIDGVISEGKPGAWLGMAKYWSPFRDEAKRKVIMECEK